MLNLLGLSAQHLSPLLLVTPASLLGRTSAASSTWFHCGCSNSQSGPRAPHQEPGKHLKSTWNEWYGEILTGSKSLNSHSFFQTYVLINRPPSLFKGNSYTPALRPPPPSSKTKTNNTSLSPSFAQSWRASGAAIGNFLEPSLLWPRARKLMQQSHALTPRSESKERINYVIIVPLPRFLFFVG